MSHDLCSALSKSLITLVIAVSMVFATIPFAKTTPNNLYLIALVGQSNASGRGDLAELPPDFPANANRLWNFTNVYTWQHPAKEPIDDPVGQVDSVSTDTEAGVGPGLSIG